MTVHLSPQGLGFVRQVTEPDYKELCPKEIQPQQSECGNQHSQALDLMRPEMRTAIYPPHDNGDRNHGGKSREHIAEPVMNREHAAVPVRDYHHCKIPGDESIARNKRNYHDR